MTQAAGAAPRPYCSDQTVLRVCTDSICAKKEIDVTCWPVVEKLNAAEAPGSPNAPVWRTPSARSVAAACTARVSAPVNGVPLLSAAA